jgi:hypothetical protein
MAAQTANRYRLEDLDDASQTRPLANSDLAALRTVADQSTSWTEATTLRPGRSQTSARPRSVRRSGRCAKEAS